MGLDGVFNSLGMQVSKLSGDLRDDLDHPCNHVVRIHSSTRASDEPCNHFFNGSTLGEIDLIVELPKRILRHRLVETGEIGSGVDRLHLNSEGFELGLHRLGNRLHGMFCCSICRESRRAQEPADG